MSTPVTIDYEDLEDALMWVSGDRGGESQAYISRTTGAIYQVSSAFGSSEEDVPGDLDDEDQYCSVPSDHDLDLGRDLVLRFASEVMPQDADAVHEFFRRRGAYARFSDLLARRGLRDRWHAYRDQATEEALREWAQECGFEVVRRNSGRSGGG